MCRDEASAAPGFRQGRSRGTSAVTVTITTTQLPSRLLGGPAVTMRVKVFLLCESIAQRKR